MELNIPDHLPQLAADPQGVPVNEESEGQIPEPQQVLAWHGDPDLKADATQRMKAHRAQDEFVQGLYVKFDQTMESGFRGCFHGCLTLEKIAEEKEIPVRELAASLTPHDDTRWHAEGERIWGIPAALGANLDEVFELLEYEDAGSFAVESVEAIPVGADLSMVSDKFEAHWDECVGDATHCASHLVQLLREAPVPE